MPRPKNVKELHLILGMTGYLCQHIEKYSIVAASLANLLRNKAFVCKRRRTLPIEWGEDRDQAFVPFKRALSSPLVFTLLSWDHPFTLYTGASSVAAGAVLMQVIDSMECIISFATYRFSKTRRT